MITLLYYIRNEEGLVQKVALFGGIFFVLILVIMSYLTFGSIATTIGTVIFGGLLLDVIEHYIDDDFR